MALAPGVDFDPVHGNGWVRLSLCVSPDDAREDCRRLGGYLGR